MLGRHGADRGGRLASSCSAAASACINSGGEKIYPEEVEEALKSHPAVFDALVAGLPDARFGQRVAAVVQLREGAAATPRSSTEHCRERIAGYKVPREIVVVPAILRSPSGKADYRWAQSTLEKESAARELATTPTQS